MPENPTPAPPKRRLITAGIVIGSLLTLSPLFGMLGTIIGMKESFAALGQAGANASSDQLSQGIGHALVSTAVGFLLFLPGIALLITSLIFRRRAGKAAAPPQGPTP